MAIPLLGFIVAMCLVGIKHAESWFRHLWVAVLLYNFTGTVLLALGACEINFPGSISRRFAAISDDYWRFIGITFFLFPVSLLVTLLRFPFRLVKWRNQQPNGDEIS